MPKIIIYCETQTSKSEANRSFLVELMSPKFKKQSALKLVGRIIHCAKHIWISCISKDIIPSPLGRNFGQGLALKFIPVIDNKEEVNPVQGHLIRTNRKDHLKKIFTFLDSLIGLC